MNGYDTALASDGFVALERFDAERPDIVLLDLMLPVMDGWAVLEQIRSRPSPPPVIVCSAARSARDLDVATHRGVDAILFKPLDPDVLLETLDRVVAASRMPATSGGLVDPDTGTSLHGIQPA
jgi:CheY-like chemotaxis protein